MRKDGTFVAEITKNLNNMKKFLSLAIIVASALQMQAQMILSENHAMLRLEQDKKYVLLPVEEKAENANVRVIDTNNQCTRRPNVRLAVDNVDYFVPLEIKDAQVLDIVFHGDRRTTGNIKDFACWKEIRYADTFDTTNRERFRPAYHHTPEYGWMNDPNGMFYWDPEQTGNGEWHLCYQWNPYGSLWENMTWGHSVSKDLIHWQHLPAAVEPDAIGTIFSGSCVVDKNNTSGYGKNSVIAFYTSAGDNQTQSMAYSTDGGRTFKKYDKNPVIVSDAPDFRDPHLFWHEPTQKWIMLLAVGQEMQIFSSPNLKDWTYESSFGREYGNHNGVWECPDLFPLDGKWVLLCNINPGGPYGGNATQYFVGQFDGHKFTCESMPNVTKWMDYGKDHYATVTFDNAPDNRRVAIVWMSNWQYANQVPTKQFRSANALPRDLHLFTDGTESYLAILPSKEVDALRANKTKKLTDACEVVVDVKGTMQLTFANTKGEQVVMTYDQQKQTFAMDRNKSGDVSFSEAFPVETVALTHGIIKQLRIFIDHSSIEVFDTNGKMAMTNLVFPSEPYNTLKVKGGKATIYELRKN